MTDYKQTLNLPQTSFPMKANLASREPILLEQWIKNQVYEAMRVRKKGATPFVLHDGPPYANGHLHCGHALNKILKDMILKSKSMSGYDAPFLPGWDCHGLPIELNVEKKIGKAGLAISLQAFRQQCRAYASSQIDIQRQEFQRLGVFGDWQHPYITMDYSYEANVVRALAKIIKNGHLQQGFKPVHWCIDCGSALAEAEVDYEEKTSPSIDVAFYAVEPVLFLEKFNTALPHKSLIVPIWTTTPWTLPANEAVCLHPSIQYTLVETREHYFIIAAELVTRIMARYHIDSYQQKGTVNGSCLEGLALKHPFNEKQVPIVLGQHVTTDSGTGCVHTAPAHGPEDYQVGQVYQLPLINPVLANGCYAQEVPFFAGQSVLKVNKNVIEVLEAQQALLFQSSIIHSYPHCWRHKTPMIFRATPQWFISMEKCGLRLQLLEQIEQVTWIPEWGKARIRNMITSRPDWCISRQRAWGTPMPLFVHRATRELHPNTLSLMEDIALRIEKMGIDAWFDLDPRELLGESDALTYEKITDTLDVWFDSGVSHFCVLQQQTPALLADIYFEGSDQHRGWFNSSLTTAVAMYGKAPYKKVLTHGYTVDAQGKKLSKSAGNYIALDKLIQQHGADVLRLWVASTDYRNEVSISEEIIKRTAEAYRRIRNTARFLLANLFDFLPDRDAIASENWVELDRWAIKRCQQLQKEIVQAYNDYHFHLIYQKIHNFCAVDMGSFYLDIIKDRQYTTPVNSHARRSCQTAMYHILHALTRWLAPILSFTAEEIWQVIPGKTEDSIFFEEWYQSWPMIEEIDFCDWEKIKTIREEVNKALEQARQIGLIGSGLSAKVTLYAEKELYFLLSRLGDELRFILITSYAILEPAEKRPENIPMHDMLGLAISVENSQYLKCERCWHRREEIGQNSDHPTLCLRCIDNLCGQEEKRVFA